MIKAACITACLVAVASQQQDYVTLNNGLKFPFVSFGLQVYSDDRAETLTGLAIQAGIRNFFASVLAGNQRGFGRAVKNSPVSRDQLFISGSALSEGCSDFDSCKQQTADQCFENLSSMQLDYLDMIMLDYPTTTCEGIRGQWAAFEDMLKSGKTKSLAVSNFSPDQLDCIISQKNNTVPTVNQMQYSVGHGKDTVVADNAKRGVIVQAWSPLDGGYLINDPDCIAIGKAHNKSSAQVALRWIVQTNATFTTSVDSLEHFQEDLALFDFKLTDADMATLNAK